MPNCSLKYVKPYKIVKHDSSRSAEDNSVQNYTLYMFTIIMFIEIVKVIEGTQIRYHVTRIIGS